MSLSLRFGSRTPPLLALSERPCETMKISEITKIFHTTDFAQKSNYKIPILSQNDFDLRRQTPTSETKSKVLTHSYFNATRPLWSKLTTETNNLRPCKILTSRSSFRGQVLWSEATFQHEYYS